MNRKEYSASRRQALRYGGIAVVGAIAGCSDGTTSEPDEEENENETETQDQQGSDGTDGTAADEGGCGPGETELASLPELNTDVTVVGEVTDIVVGQQLLYITDGTAEGAIQTGGAANAEEFSEGDCVTVPGYVTDTLGLPGDPDGAVLAYDVRTPAELRRDVLDQSLPEPSQYISSRQSDFERAVGTVEITTTTGEGELRLQGPGRGQVTAIAGYIDASDLFTLPNWGGSADEESKLFYTSAGGGNDDLEFDLFRGVALRAVAGIDLVVDGTTVAEGVRLVRYRTDGGIVETEPVE